MSFPASPGRTTAALCALAVLGACAQAPPDAERRAQDVAAVAAVLGGADTAGFARALAVRPFRFPADHGPHPDFRTEWWYVTAHLEADDGRRFGVQFTVFRSALAPRADPSASPWAARQAYMAHLAVSNLDEGEFRAWERFERGALGLAGARLPGGGGAPAGLRVWVGDWWLGGTFGAGAVFDVHAAADTFRIHAGAEDVALDLRLDEGKGIVLQGEGGLSRKGPEPGNASYYYSLPRMPTEGRLVWRGDTLRVWGVSWMDREWSTSVLGEGRVGWDWFALQLDDGRELMIYRIRRADGTDEPYSAGTLVTVEGTPRGLVWGRDVTVEEEAWWTAPDGGATYPSAWRVRLPDHGLDLTLRPLLADQELRLTFRYWEGAVEVRGADGAPAGRGFVELTGYASGEAERMLGPGGR